MKQFLVSFIFILVALLSFTVKAQSPWIIQRATGLTSQQNPQIIFSAVNKDVCWGCSFYSTQFVRTVDGGIHWTVGTIPAASGLIGSRIAAIDSNTAFVILHGASGRGIYKTSDGGLTWTRYTNAFNGTNSDPLQIFFFDSTNGVSMGNPSGGNWEIYTTSDTGTTWNRVLSAHIPASLTGETALYRGHANGADNCFWFTTWSGSLYRTSDQGITWTVTRSVLGSRGFSVAFKDSLNGVASTPVKIGNTGSGDDKLAITSDGGKTWKPINLNFTSPSYYAVNYVKGSNNDYILTSDYNRGEPGYSAKAGAAYSSDGGMTWIVIDHVSRLWADFSPDGTGWSGGENDSIYKWIGYSVKTGIDNGNQAQLNFNLFQNYPNPFNPSTTIKYSIPKASFVTLNIYDILGRNVATLVDERKSPGIYEVNFSSEGGFASGGNAVNLPSGVYIYRIQAGSLTESKKMILLK